MNKIKDKSQAVLIIVSLCLLISNFFLIFQNLKLRSDLDKFKVPQLEIGNMFETFQAKDSNSNIISVEFSENSSKRFFLYFTPTCKFCKEQFPIWKEFIQKAKEQNIEVYGIVSENDNHEDVEKYLESFDLGMNSPIPLKVIFVSDEILLKYKLVQTPITIQVYKFGKVENVWIGKWKNGEKDTIISKLQ
jgi:thiol-disulfide isomerase/thioredoxin